MILKDDKNKRNFGDFSGGECADVGDCPDCGGDD